MNAKFLANKKNPNMNYTGKVTKSFYYKRFFTIKQILQPMITSIVHRLRNYISLL